jgi:hypothetical protein
MDVFMSPILICDVTYCVTYFRLALIGKDWKQWESQNAHMACLSCKIRHKKARNH